MIVGYSRAILLVSCIHHFSATYAARTNRSLSIKPGQRPFLWPISHSDLVLKLSIIDVGLDSASAFIFLDSAIQYAKDQPQGDEIGVQFDWKGTDYGFEFRINEAETLARPLIWRDVWDVLRGILDYQMRDFAWSSVFFHVSDVMEEEEIGTGIFGREPKNAASTNTSSLKPAMSNMKTPVISGPSGLP